MNHISLKKKKRQAWVLCKATHCMSLFLGPEDKDFVILLIGVIKEHLKKM